MDVTVKPIIIDALGTVTKGLMQGLGDLERRTTGNHPNDNIIKINQNTEKSPGDLPRLAVIQTPVINHQLALEWKTLKSVIIISKKKK